MGLLTIQTDKLVIIITDFKTPNNEVKTSNNNIRIAQYQYDSTQIL